MTTSRGLRSARRRASRSLRLFEKGRDPVLRGYCAVSLGGAKEPQGVHVLREAIDGGGPPVIRSFAALGLGLAARNADARTRYGIGSFLREELQNPG